MTDSHDELRVLLPARTKPRLDAIERAVRQASGRHLSRRHALGLGGLALLAAACGGTSDSGDTGGSSSVAASGTGSKELESKLVIYNWSDYDNPATYAKFKKAHPGTSISETYFASNDELLTKLRAGGGGYDIVVPTQNAVDVLIRQDDLLELDESLLPNLKGMNPKWRDLSYDPGGKHSVVKNYGVTLFFYRNDIVKERPKSWADFYDLLPKYGKEGRTNLMEGAEEVVPLALAALGLDMNSTEESDLDKASDLLARVRPGVTTIQSSNYIAPGSAGKIVLGQGWSGDVRRIVQNRKQGDITATLPDGDSERWADNWCILKDCPHPVAAHAWINDILAVDTAVGEMNFHNYPIPIPKAIAKTPRSLREDPLFNVPDDKVEGYTFVLNPSPAAVRARTRVYNEFKAS